MAATWITHMAGGASVLSFTCLLSDPDAYEHGELVLISPCEEISAPCRD